MKNNSMCMVCVAKKHAGIDRIVQILYECKNSWHMARLRRGADTGCNVEYFHTWHGTETVIARHGPCIYFSSSYKNYMYSSYIREVLVRDEYSYCYSTHASL